MHSALRRRMAMAYEIATCPACGAAAAETVAAGDELRAEVEALWSFHTRRLRPETPPPHLHDRVVFSQRRPLRLVRCLRCGTLYRNPRERAAAVTDIYAVEPLDAAVARTLFETQRSACRRQVRRLTRAAGRPGTGLEIGSYVGGFLAEAAAAGWRFEGIDVNRDAVGFAQSLGLTACATELSEFRPGRRYDAVAFWNCFDQLPDPRAAVLRAAELLRPGGILAVRVPNGAFYGSLRARAAGRLGGVPRALLAYNNLLGFPYLHGFTPDSLGRLVGDAGFRVVRVHGDTLVPLADRWTRPWARHEERALKAALRTLTPAARAPWFELHARLTAPARLSERPAAG